MTPSETETLKMFDELLLSLLSKIGNVIEAVEMKDRILDSLLTQLRLARADERKSKDGAYHERNILVCALTKLFPSYLARHDENDMGWERDWMWIVYIDLPTGQVSWHLHDSEVVMFKDLPVQENKWDGHNTERKYERLLALSRLNSADERKQAYEDGKKEGAKWIDVLRELLLRSGESEKEIVLKEMFEVARRLDTPPAKPNY